MAGSSSDVARSLVGVAVRTGAPRPDISTPDAVKKTLAAAKSVVISSGPSGVYLNALFEKLGVMADLKPKLKGTPPGVAVGGWLAKCRGEPRLPQGGEPIHVPGHPSLRPPP